MTTQIENNEKAEVTEYFNGTGFDRWNRIYSESDDVNKVQKNILLEEEWAVCLCSLLMEVMKMP